MRMLQRHVWRAQTAARTTETAASSSAAHTGLQPSPRVSSLFAPTWQRTVGVAATQPVETGAAAASTEVERLRVAVDVDEGERSTGWMHELAVYGGTAGCAHPHWWTGSMLQVCVRGCRQLTLLGPVLLPCPACGANVLARRVVACMQGEPGRLCN
eukprot:353088-Chlamydomonas_euryale.AAC.16